MTVFLASCSPDITLSDISIAPFPENRKCALSFTFDDGMKEHFTIVAPELEKRGWRGTFWLNGVSIHDLPMIDTTHMTWNEVKIMSDNGHEMSNHGWSHKNLTELSPREAWEEMQLNDIIIERHTGKRPMTFCFPYNEFNPNLLRLAAENRTGSRKEQFWLGGEHSDDEYLHKQIEDAIASGNWITSMTHGINYGYDAFGSPDRFISFLDYVKEREEDIYVGTFHEISAYRKEAESIKLETVKDKAGTFVKTRLLQDPEIFNTQLTLVVNHRVKARQDGKRLKVVRKDGVSIINFNPYLGGLLLY